MTFVKPIRWYDNFIIFEDDTEEIHVVRKQDIERKCLNKKSKIYVVYKYFEIEKINLPVVRFLY